jgi:plasmid stabilization system protein ParE
MKYVFAPKAMDDARDAAAFYEAQRDGLGARFLIELGVGLAQLLESPISWPEYESGLRKYRLRNFPYGILYRMPTSELVLIVAIFDLRRRPGSWRR